MNININNIIHYIILKGPCIKDIGLFHGKMGLVVALYAYADKYDDKVLKDFAWDLLQQIYENVHADLPVGLEYGLAGIGYGITLLYKKGLINCDLNAALFEIDAKIMEHDPRRIADCSVRTGIAGLQLYIMLRQSTDQSLLTFDSRYLSELPSVAGYQTKSDPTTAVFDIINEPSFAISEYVENHIGIDGGSAYYIFKDIFL